MQHLIKWQRDRQLLQVKTSDRTWTGRLVKSKESRFEVALELELEQLELELLEQKDYYVVVIPWHAVEYVKALDAHTDG